MSQDEVSDMWNLFHQMWSRDVNSPGYAKSKWLRLEALLAKLVGYKPTTEVQKPPPGVLLHEACKVCGVRHRGDEAHLLPSAFYQYGFIIRHGRLPTWGDACGHLKPEDARHYQVFLANLWSEPSSGVGAVNEPGGTP